MTDPAPADRSRDIYDRILAAIVEHRLAPGTRLREERLAEMFDVSRTQVRPVLQQLQHEGLVERKPRRGAVVAAPSREQAAAIFDARRLVEPYLVERVCSHCSRTGLRDLQRIVRDECAARTAGDHRAVVRLSGDFHRQLATLAGNAPLTKLMGELTVQTCLAIVACRAPTGSTCREDEHERILEAITARDVRRARRLMTEHLDHIERALDAPVVPIPDDDLSALLVDDPPARTLRKAAA